MVVNRAVLCDVTSPRRKKDQRVFFSFFFLLFFSRIDSIGSLGQWEATICQVHPSAIGCTAKRERERSIPTGGSGGPRSRVTAEEIHVKSSSSREPRRYKASSNGTFKMAKRRSCAAVHNSTRGPPHSFRLCWKVSRFCWLLCLCCCFSFFLLVLALGLQRRGRTTECPVPSVDAERSVQVDTPPKSSSSFLFFIHPYLHHHHQQSNTTNLMEYSESF